LELFEQESDVGVRCSVPDQEQLAAVGGGHAHVEHLQGRPFLEDDSGHQPGRVAPQVLTQGRHEE
jgi:hypothetical protein